MLCFLAASVVVVLVDIHFPEVMGHNFLLLVPGQLI